MDSTTSTTHKVDLEHMLLDESADPTHLPLSLLQDITDNFSDDQQIGVGGFAVVYKGILRKGTVAVKKLIQGPNVDESKFHKEVECMMKAKHKNIVRFLGYCSDAQGRVFDYEGKFVMADLRNWLLCFEYLPNGSLDNYINDASHGLEWKERYQIIKGICEGLLHLHEKRIIHLDLKPSNILVDDQILPKIADFGLSRCLDKEQTRYFTSRLCGSPGYLAPEFYRGQVSFASDIYSLGVIILEILTGEKGYPEDENVVENWMNRLEGSNQWDTQLEQVRVCTKIGIECMDLDPKKRPLVQHIIDRLEKTTSTIETAICRSSVDQHVSFLQEKCCQEKNLDISSEYLRKDIKECAATEEITQYGETLREDHWHQGQQEAPRGSAAAEEAMALAAALARAATRLFRGGLPPSAASLAPSSRSRLFCSLPADNEPSAPGGVEQPWEEAEAEILRGVDPVVALVKDILHSSRYEDGDLLSPDDEKVIVEEVLAHHPRSADKIGCGLEAIMVDKHPVYRRSRCLFVVRTNGDVEDFSYRKCLRASRERAVEHLEELIARLPPK